MTRQIEFANNLRTEQGNDVGTNREFEAGKHFFGDCCAAEHMPALEYKHALARAREIRSVNQAIMTTADDDAVVLFHVANADCRESVPSALADGINGQAAAQLFIPFANANGTDSAAQALIRPAHQFSIQTTGTGDTNLLSPDPISGVTSPLSVSISNNLSGASPATINLAEDLIRNLALSENV